MGKLLTMSAVLLLGFFVYPKPAHAIIFLPAVLLIPVAKIIALVIGGFFFPALGIAAIIHQFFNKPLGKIIFLIILLLIILAVSVAIYLKIQNPNRPWI